MRLYHGWMKLASSQLYETSHLCSRISLTLFHSAPEKLPPKRLPNLDNSHWVIPIEAIPTHTSSHTAHSSHRRRSYLVGVKACFTPVCEHPSGILIGLNGQSLNYGTMSPSNAPWNAVHMVQVARGRSGTPYFALTCFSYAGFLFYLRTSDLCRWWCGGL